jgi:hypothetical protein
LECGDVTPLSFVSPVFHRDRRTIDEKQKAKSKKSGVTSPHSKFQILAAQPRCVVFIVPRLPACEMLA